jgi:hypothetical protein
MTQMNADEENGLPRKFTDCFSSLVFILFICVICGYKPLRFLLSPSAPYRFGTGAPQSRQVTALRWRGRPQRGQTRRPASAFTAAGASRAAAGTFAGAGRAGGGGATATVSAARFSPLAGVADDDRRGEAWRAVQRSSVRRSWVLISSVGVSGSRDFTLNIADDDDEVTAGTGTIRPQSGHLPDCCAEPPEVDSARTFNRRPHEQEKRTNPSPAPTFGASRRTLIRDAHLGQITRSGPFAGKLKTCPQRHVARGMSRRPFIVICLNEKRFNRR